MICFYKNKTKRTCIKFEDKDIRKRSINKVCYRNKNKKRNFSLDLPIWKAKIYKKKILVREKKKKRG